MKCKNWPIAVCSWSLREDITGVARAMADLGIEHVHLAVRSAVSDKGYLAAVEKQNWNITSTMIDFPQEDYSTLDSIMRTGGIVPDDCWEDNKQLFMEAADVTRDLGVEYISMHAGFIDETDTEYAARIAGRIRCLADAAAERQLTLLLETGQETAGQLRDALKKYSLKDGVRLFVKTRAGSVYVFVQTR